MTEDIDCVFCKIAKGGTPATVEAETDNVIAFVSVEPVAKIHILIIPKKHIAKFVNITDGDSKLVSEMVSVAQGLIKSKGIRVAYRLVFNGGKYQAVPHLHWHLLGGNSKGDGIMDGI